MRTTISANVLKCRETKLNLSNHTSQSEQGRQSNEPIKTQSKYGETTTGAGKTRVTTGSVSALLLIGGESGGRIFNQSQSVAMQNQTIANKITFNTQFSKTVLIGVIVSE